MATETILRLDHLTYRGNSKESRYGWLRLTPAFSVHLAQEFIRDLPGKACVLDPFCGTGTTALVCAEEGVHCESTDINHFLLWLAEAKCATYSANDLAEAKEGIHAVVNGLRDQESKSSWVPPLHQIEKWWEPPVLNRLARVWTIIQERAESTGRHATTLHKLAFCRMMIELANVSFSHQSMSFKKSGQTPLMDIGVDETEFVINKWEQTTRSVLQAAQTRILAEPRFYHADARNLDTKLPRDLFDCVVTSPPYPNRMSYIRELRPYMFWLGYLTNGRDAGELDWEAIGGTWGCATSKLITWRPPTTVSVPFSGFEAIVSQIARKSSILSQYVRKYFYDMTLHVGSIFKVVKSGGVVHYIVGNSKFYDVLLPVDEIFVSLFSSVGFIKPQTRVIRKRTSKKELFEYVVSAQKP